MACMYMTCIYMFVHAFLGIAFQVQSMYFAKDMRSIGLENRAG